MVHLGALHWIYLAMVVVVLITMIMRRDTVLPCIAGLLLIGFVATGSPWKALTVMYNALIAAGNEFIGIITVIALVVAMSKAMTDVGTDQLIMAPAARIMKSPTIAFWVTGITMLVVTLFIWPSPAVALIGAIITPVAVRAGLPAIGAAIAMNLFGHGMGLSFDFVIQGAPGITAKFAGLPDASYIIRAELPMWITMSVVTAAVAFYMLKKDLAANKAKHQMERLAYEEAAAANEKKEFTWVARFGAILFPVLMLADIVIMYKFKLRGGDASALIGGTALFVAALLPSLQYKGEALEKITDYVRDGFMFGIKVFAPVIVIGAFFFLGSEGTAKAILGENATGLLNDMGIALSQAVPMAKAPVAFIQLLIGGITGLDGSGFSGLPLVGSLAQTFGSATGLSVAGLGALGQISANWVGGGTIIPWGIIPVAAICGVDANELARRNFIPVMIGFVATFIVSLFVL